MKRTALLLTASISLMLSMSACIVYYPQAVDIPLINEKKDLRIDAGISMTASAHATVSYGLTDKVAVQAFGRYGNEREDLYVQTAGGIYKKHQNGFITEYYGGYGYGEKDRINHGDGDMGSLYGNYQLVFLQMNIGRRNIRFANLDYGLSLKTGLLNANFTDTGWWQDYYYEPGYTYSDMHFLLEPTAVVRFGGKRLKFNIKGGLCYIPYNKNADFELPYGKWNVAIGLNWQSKRRIE
jgi:hypothetical protein